MTLQYNHICICNQTDLIRLRKLIPNIELTRYLLKVSKQQALLVFHWFIMSYIIFPSLHCSSEIVFTAAILTCYHIVSTRTLSTDVILHVIQIHTEPLIYRRWGSRRWPWGNCDPLPCCSDWPCTCTCVWVSGGLAGCRWSLEAAGSSMQCRHPPPVHTPPRNTSRL